MIPENTAVGQLVQFSNPDTVCVRRQVLGIDIHGDLCQVHIGTYTGSSRNPGIVQDIPDQLFCKFMGRSALKIFCRIDKNFIYRVDKEILK